MAPASSPGRSIRPVSRRRTRSNACAKRCHCWNLPASATRNRPSNYALCWRSSERAVDPDTHLADAMRCTRQRRTARRTATHERSRRPIATCRGIVDRAPTAQRQLPMPHRFARRKQFFLQAASAVGHTRFPARSRRIVRTDASVVHAGSDSIPSLASAIAARALDVAPTRSSSQRRRFTYWRSRRSARSKQRMRCRSTSRASDVQRSTLLAGACGRHTDAAESARQDRRRSVS